MRKEKFLSASLVGKKVLITGASSGIGQAIAILFAKEGADLCLVSRRAKELSGVAEQCRRNFGSAALAIAADITDENDVKGMAQKMFYGL